MKHHKLKEVRDWCGEYWDAYEEYKSPSGLLIYKGWPYGLTPRDGIGGVFSYILTPEIADYLHIHTIIEAKEQLSLSLSIIGKFRRLLNLTKKRFYRNDHWLLEHQEEILHLSFQKLKEKYGLSRSQVYLQRKWLAELVEFSTSTKLRKSQSAEQQEEWYQTHKNEIQHKSIEEIQAQFKVSHFIALKYYNRSRQEQSQLLYSEQIKQNKLLRQQWLLDHQDQILNPDKHVKDIAKELTLTEAQVLRARAKLRKLKNIPKVKEQNTQWLMKHKELLLSTELSNEALAQQLKLTQRQLLLKKHSYVLY